MVDDRSRDGRTTAELPGNRIAKNLGGERGIVVRSRSIIGTVGASLQTLLGGNITLYTDLCEAPALTRTS